MKKIDKVNQNNLFTEAKLSNKTMRNTHTVPENELRKLKGLNTHSDEQFKTAGTQETG